MHSWSLSSYLHERNSCSHVWLQNSRRKSFCSTETCTSVGWQKMPRCNRTSTLLTKSLVSSDCFVRSEKKGEARPKTSLIFRTLPEKSRARLNILLSLPLSRPSFFLLSGVLQVFWWDFQALAALFARILAGRQVLSGDHTTTRGTVRPSPTLLISIERRRRLWFPMPNGE